ncbi:MAG: class I SAM-dependent methyltransferase [Desulfuromonadales bacterium]|nr:class I SAM-dependent methyltransferase [Desulfuromonadales bacterium]
MKRCLKCKETFSAEDWTCPQCDSSPESGDGYLSFAQPCAGDGFQPGFFEELATVEKGHFWFCARNNWILTALKRFFPELRSLLEVGCGTGFVLSGISKSFPRARLMGSDYFAEGLPFAQKRVSQASFMQADVRELPFVEAFDVVGAFDVLEHVEDDVAALSSIFEAVRPDGGVMLTVPQHRWLWSATDDYACHVRRYTRKELCEKLSAAGFSVEYATSFVSFLLPVMLLSRWTRRKEIGNPLSELKISPLLNKCFAVLMALESRIAQCGVTFPCGGSLLVVAKKAASPTT